MAKKKNLKDLDSETLEYIDDKMNNGVEERYNQQAASIQSKVLDYKIALKCKNKKQKEYHNLIKKNTITLCSGEAGTGKSYVALATALELLKDPKMPFNKILIIVPTVEAGNMSIGYLKGTLEEKIAQYCYPSINTMEKIIDQSSGNGREKVKELKKSGKLEFAPLSFQRGLTHSNTLVLLEEAENLNQQELFLLLSRIGENSKYIILGDSKQLDRKDIRNSKKKCGLDYAIEKLDGLEDVGIIHFGKEDIVRHPLIGKIMDRWFGIEGEPETILNDKDEDSSIIEIISSVDEPEIKLVAI